MSLANSKQSFKSDVSINSDDIGSKEVTHDIYQVIPKDVIFEKTDHNNNSITNSPQDELINELLKIIHEEIKDISATNMQDLMRLTNLDVSNDEAYTHEIIIKPDTEPIKQKVRKIPYSFASEFRNMIEEMKRAGMIVDSSSPWCSPVRLVRKKDGTVRICVDFRKLNNVTVKDAYPIPIINDLFVYLAKAKVFSTLDLKSGYFQVKMKPESQALTAFACEFGFYEYKVMPMGLTNACATFQRLMNKVLAGLVGKICLVYLDDIIIYSNNELEHVEHIRLVCERLRQHNLKIAIHKCKFFKKRIEYLSHVIEDGQLLPNPLKVEAINKIQPPINVKQIQAFLGLASYYRKFIKSFSQIASPLIQLTEKNKRFEWDETCSTAFNILKTALVSEQILILPDFNEEFVLDTDACGYGAGAVLSQKRNGQLHPVAYFSKHLSKVERRYSTSERELLAIVLAVEYFKQYVYGRHFKIRTDHEPLKYLLTVDTPSARLGRLHNRLKMYDFDIEYRAGKQNQNADALSRIVTDELNGRELDENDNDIIINVVHLEPVSLKEEQLQDEDIAFIYALKRFERTGQPKPIIKQFVNETQQLLYKQWSKLIIINNNLYREYVKVNGSDESITYQYVVPKKQVNYVLKMCHDHVFSGHLGFEKTRDKITERFYWPNQLKDIDNHIKSCESCQLKKDPKQKNHPELIPILPTKPFQIITTDIMGPLPRTAAGNKYILVICDHFTKYVEVFALRDQQTPKVARCLLQFICRHSVPDQILSDQGTNYQSEILAEVYALLDVERLRTAPYHAQTDGLSERFNRTLQTMIAHYTNDKRTNWDIHLPVLQFAYNTATHTTTKATPFEMVYGRKPKIPIDLVLKDVPCELLLSNDSYANELKEAFNKAYQTITTNRDVKMEKNKLYCDRKIFGCTFKPGDLVWWRNFKTKTGEPKKFRDRWRGIYQVVQVINVVDCEIKLYNQKGARKKVVHMSQLKRAFLRDHNNEHNDLKTILYRKHKRTKPFKLNLDENLPDLELYSLFNEQDHQQLDDTTPSNDPFSNGNNQAAMSNRDRLFMSEYSKSNSTRTFSTKSSINKIIHKQTNDNNSIISNTILNHQTNNSNNTTNDSISSQNSSEAHQNIQNNSNLSNITNISNINSNQPKNHSIHSAQIIQNERPKRTIKQTKPFQHSPHKFKKKSFN